MSSDKNSNDSSANNNNLNHSIGPTHFLFSVPVHTFELDLDAVNNSIPENENDFFEDDDFEAGEFSSNESYDSNWSGANSDCSHELDFDTMNDLVPEQKEDSKADKNETSELFKELPFNACHPLLYTIGVPLWFESYIDSVKATEQAIKEDCAKSEAEIETAKLFIELPFNPYPFVMKANWFQFHTKSCTSGEQKTPITKDVVEKIKLFKELPFKVTKPIPPNWDEPAPKHSSQVEHSSAVYNNLNLYFFSGAVNPDTQCPLHSKSIPEEDEKGAEIVELSKELPYTMDNGGFEMLSDVPPTHHFLNKNDLKQHDGSLLKVICREIAILKSSLPPGIWVKGFEDRMDLFSALIRGPTGTPYEDGLFVFDILLPDGYPNVPPRVFYYAYKKRMNPNLYNNGKVCLSLLGTWPGKAKEEVWTKKSTLLQVVLSIQSLILNNEPYYNEPCINKESPLKTMEYNAALAHFTMQILVYLHYRPHPAFKTEIKAHGPKNFKKISDRLMNWIDASELFNIKYKKVGPGGRYKVWMSGKVDKSSVMEPPFTLLPLSDKNCKVMREDILKLSKLR